MTLPLTAGVVRDAIPPGIFPGTVGSLLRVEPLLPGIRPGTTPPGIIPGTAGSPIRIRAAQNLPGITPGPLEYRLPPSACKKKAIHGHYRPLERKYTSVAKDTVTPLVYCVKDRHSPPHG